MAIVCYCLLVGRVTRVGGLQEAKEGRSGVGNRRRWRLGLDSRPAPQGAGDRSQEVGGHLDFGPSLGDAVVLSQELLPLKHIMKVLPKTGWKMWTVCKGPPDAPTAEQGPGPGPRAPSTSGTRHT